jgi:hypothetical protein
MRHVLAVLLVVCLAAAGSAWAGHQDPQKRLTRADNARARAMLVRQADLPPGFRAQPASTADPHVSCPRSVSEADLTLTGEAEGRRFALGVTSVASSAEVYRSRRDANASWRRSNSSAGVACARTLLRNGLASQGIRVQSLRRIAFPRVSERTVAYRVHLLARTPQGTVALYLDLVALMHTRAVATVVVGTPFVPPSRSDELRLARLVAGRMESALRR